MYQGSSPCYAAAAAVLSYRRVSRLDSTNTRGDVEGIDEFDVGGDALACWWCWCWLVLVGVGLLDGMITVSSTLAGGKCFVIISHKQIFAATSTSLLLLPLPHQLSALLHLHGASTGGI
jgi:hypothetical protein